MKFIVSRVFIKLFFPRLFTTCRRAFSRERDFRLARYKELSSRPPPPPPREIACAPGREGGEGVPAMRRLIKFSGPRAGSHARIRSHTFAREPETRVHALIRLTYTSRARLYLASRPRRAYSLSKVLECIVSRCSSPLASQQPATSLPPALSFTAFLLRRSPLSVPVSIFLYACIYLRPLSASIPAIRSGRGSRPERGTVRSFIGSQSDSARTHTRERERAMRRASGTGEKRGSDDSLLSIEHRAINAKCRENRRKRETRV